MNFRNICRCPSCRLRCVISAFRSEVAKNCALLGYYAARSGNFLRTFRDIVSGPSAGFKNLSPPSTLRMGTMGCPETSVRNYDLSLRNNPEGRNSYVYCKFSLPDSFRPRCFKRIICDSLRCCKGLEFLYNRCGICGGQGGTETGCLEVFSLSPVIVSPMLLHGRISFMHHRSCLILAIASAVK
jgi:hypothetical protein